MAFEGKSFAEVWTILESEGWRIEKGPRGNTFQTYYLPAGVSRGPGFRNRKDYFDSKSLVLKHVTGGGGEIAPVPAKAAKRKKAADPPRQAEDVLLPEEEAVPQEKPKRKKKEAVPDNRSAEPDGREKLKKKATRKPKEAADVQSEAEVAEEVEVADTVSLASSESKSESSKSSSSDEVPLLPAGTSVADPAPGISTGPQESPEVQAPKPHAPATVLASPAQPEETQAGVASPEEQLSDEELTAKVLSLKAIIEATTSSTPQELVVYTLNCLKTCGPFSVEVFRATLIGKAVNALRQKTKNSAIHASAHALLLTWRDLVNSAPVGLPEPTGINPLAMTTPDKRNRSPADPTPDALPGAESKRRRQEAEAEVADAEPTISDMARYAKHTMAQDKSPTQGGKPRKGKSDISSPSARSPASRVVSRKSGSVHSVSDDGKPLVKRDASNDFVLQLDSGEHVVLQCDLKEGVTSLRHVCSAHGNRLLRDDQISEAVAFWEDLQSAALGNLSFSSETGSGGSCWGCVPLSGG